MIPMPPSDETLRDLAALRIPRTGSLLETGDPWEPYRLVDPAGVTVGAVAAWLKDLQGVGRPATTLRSYGMALLRWFRFLWALGVPWNQATRAEARDFSRWIQLADKPGRPRRQKQKTNAASISGAPNPVTGKPTPGRRYAPTTRAHSETVLRSFYEFHQEMDSGPMVNPFPLARERRRGRAHAHHNPLEPFRNEKVGLYRPKLVQRVPRSIPDEKFNELFAKLGSHRDRALVAFWVSTGARAAELLGAHLGDADAGQQLITVVRKGTRAIQQLPASPDAFVWLRLYQAQLHGLVPVRRDDPLWWTLRRPFRRLTYHAAYRMFHRANATMGANWSLHDLRHTAAYRMARDPDMPLTDVQWVLGHAQLTTTQIYTNPQVEDVITAVLAHHARQAGQVGQAGQAERTAEPSSARAEPPRSRYRPETLNVLFGEGTL